MSGECVSYRMNGPVGWKEFRSWPDDIQGEYVMRLQTKYNVQAKDIAQMFNVSPVTLSEWSKKHGVVWPRRGKDSAKAGDGWYEFLGFVPATISAVAEEPVNEPETVTETPVDTSETVCERVDRLTKGKGLSRRQLAIMAKISPSTLQSAMQRNKGLPLDLLIPISEVLNVDYAWLKSGVCDEPVEAKTTLQADHNNIAAILAMLVGTGAKLTIEVTL